MSDDNKKQPSIFEKLKEASIAVLDSEIAKAKSISTSTVQSSPDMTNVMYAKAMTSDPNFSMHSSGYKDKISRLRPEDLLRMSIKDSVIAAIIQTRQNQISNFSVYSDSDSARGWKIEVKNRKLKLQEIKDELKAPKNNEDSEEKELDDWELNRQAADELNKRTSKRLQEIKEFITHCGIPSKKEFEFKKWNFNTVLKAWVRDSLTYDLHATELVYSKLGNLVYFIPVDGGTIKYTSPQLKNYKDMTETFTNLDILYPDRSPIAQKKYEALKVDDQKLDNEEYVWCQVVRGKIERAYTDSELKVGIRNLNTNIYNHGYGISELEILVALVTGHLNAEFYNQSYFTQGFSAKGILHIMADLPPRKLETLRQEWMHLVRGSRNSFQTPIFSGVNEVKWIPLTQNHNDIGFEGWMRYLIRMMCAIYQIDPAEIGVNLKDEGSSGISGNNTQEKIDHSRDRGLFPLLCHLQSYINENIMPLIDPEYEFKFTGISGETTQERHNRQKDEVKYLKTVNEIRAENGLPPIPGMDDMLLDGVFMQWYAQFSDKAKELRDEQAKMAMDQMMAGQDGSGGAPAPTTQNPDDLLFGSNTHDDVKKSNKLTPIKVEYYSDEEH